MCLTQLLDDYDKIFHELYAAQGFTTGWLGTGKRKSHREIHEINARRMAKRQEILDYV